MALAGLLIVVAYMWRHLWNDSETSAHSCCSPTVNWISSEGQQACQSHAPHKDSSHQLNQFS